VEELKMAKCSFCNQTIAPGTGTMYVKKDGKILWFCSMKCEKNMLKLGRKSSHYKWSRGESA
jgi:large subunit ribosomal protein L24e